MLIPTGFILKPCYVCVMNSLITGLDPITLYCNSAQLVISDYQIISVDAVTVTDYCAHTAMSEAIRDGLLDDMAVNELNTLCTLAVCNNRNSLVQLPFLNKALTVSITSLTSLAVCKPKHFYTVSKIKHRLSPILSL